MHDGTYVHAFIVVPQLWSHRLLLVVFLQMLPSSHSVVKSLPFSHPVIYKGITKLCSQSIVLQMHIWLCQVTAILRVVWYLSWSLNFTGLGAPGEKSKHEYHTPLGGWGSHLKHRISDEYGRQLSSQGATSMEEYGWVVHEPNKPLQVFWDCTDAQWSLISCHTQNLQQQQHLYPMLCSYIHFRECVSYYHHS